MANSTTAFGLRPLGKVGGAYAAGSQSEYEIASAQASSIFQGDLVALSGGYIVPVQSSATGSILGVFNGCLIESDPSTGKPTFRNNYTQTTVTEGKIKAFIIDDPDQLYLVKSTGTATGITSVGTAFDINYAAGDSTNGISGVTLDLASSTDGQMLIVGLDSDPDNEVAAASENFIVKIAKGQQLI
jgi:hypothetical protein